MSDAQTVMLAVDAQISHIWMVRTFLKHSDEASEDDELASVHRDLYDFMLAVGPSFEAQDAEEYLRQARKKLSKLKRASQLLTQIQPEISGHTNFRMAAKSLELASQRVSELLG